MKMSRKLIIGAVAGLAVVGAGAAVAATQFGDPKAESEAIIKDAAGQLGVQPAQLSDALKKAYKNRIDAAVAAGRLSKEQGDAIKAQIDAGNVPLLVPGASGFRGGFGPMGGAAPARWAVPASATTCAAWAPPPTTSGSRRQSCRPSCRAASRSRTSPRIRASPSTGSSNAMVADAKKHLDQAVKDGHLTQAQADQILGQIKQHITDFVNGTAPKGFGPSFRGGSGFQGPGGPPSFRQFRQGGGMGTGSGASA